MENGSWVREISHPAGFVVPASSRISRSSLAKAGCPDDLRDAILAAYHRLGRGWVVVHSSATPPGTRKEVKGDDALIDAIVRAWMAGFTESAERTAAGPRDEPGVEIDVTATTRILVPTDFSACSEAAARVAAQMAGALGGTIDLLHVRALPLVPPFAPAAASLIEMELRDEVAREQADARLQAQLDSLEAEGHPHSRSLQSVGDAADEIVAFAIAGNYDFIVMGTHGRGAVGRFFIGSVAIKVMREAPCPVITVREGGDQPSLEPRARP